MRRWSVIGVMAGLLVPAAGLMPALPASAASAVPAACTAACHGWHVVASPSPGPVASALSAVAATSRRNAWAVGAVSDPARGTSEPLTEHWDGSAWAVVRFPRIPGAVSGVSSLSGVAAVSRTNSWAVGSYLARGGFRTLIAHWNGTSWRIVRSPNVGTGENILTAVAARTATGIWAVGFRNQVSRTRERTLVEHWNGRTWQVVPSPNAGNTGSALFGVAVVSGSRAWAVGNESNSDGSTLAERWNGSAWSVLPTRNRGDGERFLRAVAAPSPRRAFAVGSYNQRHGVRTHDLAERWIRSRWFSSAGPDPGRRFDSLQAVAARSATRAWAVGSTRSARPGRFRTLAERWNGTRWRVAATPSPGTGDDGLSGIAAIPHRGGFWAVGEAAGRTLIEFHC
jgi:hypothetical protein